MERPDDKATASENVPLLSEDGVVIGVGHLSADGIVVTGMFDRAFSRVFSEHVSETVDEGYTLDEALAIELDKLP